MGSRRFLLRLGIVLMAAGGAGVIWAFGHWAWPQAPSRPTVTSSVPPSAAEEKGRIIPTLGAAAMDDAMANCLLVQHLAVASCLLVLGGGAIALAFGRAKPPMPDNVEKLG